MAAAYSWRGTPITKEPELGRRVTVSWGALTGVVTVPEQHAPPPDVVATTACRQPVPSSTARCRRSVTGIITNSCYHQPPSSVQLTRAGVDRLLRCCATCWQGANRQPDVTVFRERIVVTAVVAAVPVLPSCSVTGWYTTTNDAALAVSLPSVACAFNAAPSLSCTRCR